MEKDPCLIYRGDVGREFGFDWYLGIWNRRDGATEA